MNGICIGDFSRGDDIGDIEIRLRAWRRTYTDGLIGKTHMEAISVGSTIYRYGLDAHFLAGTNNSQGNLTAVGYQDFLEHVFNYQGSIINDQSVLG